VTPSCHNFYPGPGALPKSVLDTIAKELYSYQGSGLSIMEFSHRSAQVVDLIDDTLERFSNLLGLDSDWEPILLQGGASLQFLMVPYNLSRPGDSIDYVDTGHWSRLALEEAGYCQRDVHVIASGAEDDYRTLPELTASMCSPEARYLHLCSNNTVVGSQWHQFPKLGIPLVIDASSDLLSRHIDLDGVNLIYAHAQKNVGLSGVTLVAVRRSAMLLDESLPKMLRYQTHIDKRSNYHTPPVFAIYVTNLMLKWLENEIGGVEAMAGMNQEKARRLYATIDNSQLFHCRIEKPCRSTMNAVFTTWDRELDESFVSYCDGLGIVGVAGHRSQGGLRASLYNSVTLDSVMALIEAVDSFEKTCRNSLTAGRSFK
jgi:phosphoserine aminotransferase